ncbi:conserved hypothetical protein [Paraburkholderia ribeironis]|uniref:Uncharacterized protein n=1 Tax=Paraburkholderia ribeironis TaxID=1247936 RepID=A0A1N7SDK0_9BURK|nr:hypothetical protein [Paraburkholderia ribeironis]SIT45450.1 conserved hypothetical protein [Paraburkholderia ribeironis]
MANILYHIVGHGLDGDNPPLSLIVLNLVYLDTDHNYSATHWCALTAAHPEDTWQFDPGPATAGGVLYDGLQFGPTGEATPIPLTVADGTTIEVGAGIPATTAVAVTPLLIDWSRVTRVDAALAGHPLTFTAASATARWLSLPAAGYTWTATYTLNDGSKWAQSGAGSTPLLVLPALPPVTTVTFTPVADYFETLPIESIALTVGNPGGAPGHSVFDPGHTQPWSTGIFQTAISPVAWRLGYRYRYVVTFKASAGLQPFDSGDIDGRGATSVTLDEVGIREFVLAGPMPALIQSVDVRYESGGKNEKHALPVRLVAGSNYTAGSFSYRLEYTIAGKTPDSNGHESGNVIQPGAQPALAFVSAASPLREKSVTLTARKLGAGDQVQLVLGTSESGNLGIPSSTWAIQGIGPANVTLDRAHPSVTYRYVVVDPDSAATVFTGTLQVHDELTPFDVPTAGTSVEVTPHTLPASVTLDPSLIDWNVNDHLKVTVTFKSAPNDGQDFPFTRESGYGYASGTSVDGVTLIYGYVARYYLADGTMRIESADNQTSMLLILPPRGTGQG